MDSLPASDPAFAHRPLTLRSRADIEAEVRRRVEAERQRLLDMTRQEPAAVQHFRRPAERPFTPAERDRVTILIGGLTGKHDALLKAAFESAGLSRQVMPTPDVAAFQLGKEKEYGNNGPCNPTYFMVGHLHSERFARNKRPPRVSAAARTSTAHRRGLAPADW